MRKADRYQAARKAIPLPTLWRRYGWPLSRSKKDERLASSISPCCGESRRKDACSLYLSANEEWRYHCFRCGSGGSAIDLVAKMEGVTADEAVKRLLVEGGGYEAIIGRLPPPATKRATDSERREAVRKIANALRDRSLFPRAVREYLTGKRGIAPDVVDEAIHRGVIAALPERPDAADVWLRLNVGEDVLKAAGLLRAGQRRMAAAYKPLAFIAPQAGGVEFRAIEEVQAEMPKCLHYGSKQWPLAWQPKRQATTIMVVEGGIDMLACASLGFDADTIILGLLGVGSWTPGMLQAIRDKYASAKWLVALDADEAGRNASASMLEVLAGLGAQAERLEPWSGKDWADTLIAARSFTP